MLGNFHLGLRKDDGRHSRATFDKMRSSLGAKPRGYANLSTFAPPVMDQGSGAYGTSSCVGHGLSGGIYTTLAARGAPLGFVPSPWGIYVPALCIDRAADNPHASVMNLPALRDIGTFVLSGVQACADWGVTALQTMPSDCTPASVTREPDLLTLEQASTKLVVGAVELNVFDMKNIERDVQLALDNNFTVVSGAYVGKPWQDYTATSSPLGAQDASDGKGGGHCTFLDGYETDPATGLTLYYGQNSWNKAWGRGGRFVCTGAAVQQWWEAYILKVEVK